MKVKYIVVLVITVILVGAIGLMCWQEFCTVPDVLFCVEVEQGGKISKLSCWQGDDGFYAALPQWVLLDEAHLHMCADGVAELDGISWEEKISCSNLAFGVSYPLHYTLRGNTYDSNITFLQLGATAALYVETQSGEMDYVHQKTGNKEAGKFCLYDSEGKLDSQGDLKAIWARGNYTWYASDKKAYGITLNTQTDILNMGEASDWILLANAADPTHLRNMMVYTFADDLGMVYSPDSQWVTLYLNGTYAGLYQLCEKNEILLNRVEISADRDMLASLELEERFNDPGIRFLKTNSGMTLRIRSENTPTDEQESLWQSVENAILAEDGIDPVSGKNYQELIDIESWAKKLLIEEVFGNIDGGIISQYFYTDCGKVYAGPVWDYDLSMGVEARWTWHLTEPDAIFAIRQVVKNGVEAPWFASLWKKEEFRDYVLSVYQEEFLPLLETYMKTWIPENAEKVAKGVAVDAIRWNASVQSAQEQTEYLTNYLTERIAFLDKLWIQTVRYCFVCIDSGQNSNFAYRAVLPGDCLESLPELEPGDAEFLGWFYCDTDVPFDISQPVTEDIAICGKWQQAGEIPLGQIVKLVPLGIIGLLGLVLLVLELRRNWKHK